MKLQFLGDSRDSFKWDYHDYLPRSLDYPLLNIAFMMTPDDNKKMGETKPELFSASKEIIKFCKYLRKEKDRRELREKFKQGYFEEVSIELEELISQLSKRTESKYSVDLHKGAHLFTNNINNRNVYFSNIRKDDRQVLFLDPDNGFEPKCNHSNKHILYSDIINILEQVSEEIVLSVFQYFRRIPFSDDFNDIERRIKKQSKYKIHATAIYTHSVMFVVASKSKDIIDKVRAINEKYPRSVRTL